MQAFGCRAIIWQYGDYNSANHTCSLTGWSGTQPTSGKITIKDTNEKDGVSYKVTAIADHALDNLTEVTEITIGKYIAKIGDNNETMNLSDLHNFNNCPKLERFKVAEGNVVYGASEKGILTDFKKKVYLRVPQRTAVTGGKFAVETEVYAFARNSFAENSTISTIVLHKGVWDFVFNCGFNRMTALEKFEQTGTPRDFKVVDGVLYDKDVTTLFSFPPRKIGADFVIPSTVTTIGEEAFRGVNNLYKIDFGQVTEIKKEAFRECGLTEIELPNRPGLLIGEGLFRGCYRLVKINIPGKLLIPKNFARDCAELKSVMSFSGDCEYGDNAFKNCRKLSSFRFTPDMKLTGDSIFAGCGFENVEFSSGALPYDGLQMGHQLFYGCQELRSIDMSSLVISNGNPGLEVGIEFAAQCPFLKTVRLPRLSHFWGNYTNGKANFGINSNVKTLVMGAYEHATGSALFRYDSGNFSPDIYMLVTGAPYKSWPLHDSFRIMPGVVFTPSLYCEAYTMKISDSNNPLQYILPGAKYYIPGATMGNYADAAAAGCKVEEMYSLSLSEEAGHLKITMKSNMGDRLVFKNVMVNGSTVAQPDANGNIIAGISQEALQTMTIEYEVNGIGMHTVYPGADLSAVSDIHGDADACISISIEDKIVRFGREVSFEVHDLKGCRLLSGMGDNADLSQLPSGVYAVSIKLPDSGMMVRKVAVR